VHVHPQSYLWAKKKKGHATAARNHPRLGLREMKKAGLICISLIHTSGCGTTVKDYGHMFRTPDLAGRCARLGASQRLCRGADDT